MNPQRSRRASLLGELIVPLAAFLALYVLTISGNLSIAHDSIHYINRIDAGPTTDLAFRTDGVLRRDLFYHPHHLLYNGLASAWVALCRTAGVASDSSYLVSLLNAVFGSLTLCVFYLLLRTRLGLGRATALAGTALPALSFGFWFYSVCVEVYIIPVFLLTLSLYLLTSSQVSARRFGLVGFTHGLAVLFHQVHLLFLPVVVVVALTRRTRHGSSAWRSLLVYASVLVLTVGIPYAWVMLRVLRITSAEAIWKWLTIYAYDPSYWNRLSPSTLAKAGIGFGRSIVGLHFVFGLTAASSLIRDALPG